MHVTAYKTYIYIYIYTHMYACMYGWMMDGWMDGWMDVRMYAARTSFWGHPERSTWREPNGPEACMGTFRAPFKAP